MFKLLFATLSAAVILAQAVPPQPSPADQLKLIRQINRMKTPEPTGVTPDARDCPFCVSRIPIAATRCPHCTSELRPGAAGAERGM